MRFYEIHAMDPFDDDAEQDRLLQIRYDEVKDQLKYITNINSLELWAQHWPPKYEDPTRFIFKDAFGEPVGLASTIGHSPKTLMIRMIYVKREFRGRIARNFYGFLIKSGFRLITDIDQTPAAKRVWKSLMDEFSLYLVNNEDKIRPITNDTEFELAYTKGSGYSRILAKKKAA